MPKKKRRNRYKHKKSAFRYFRGFRLTNSSTGVYRIMISKQVTIASLSNSHNKKVLKEEFEKNKMNAISAKYLTGNDETLFFLNFINTTPIL